MASILRLLPLILLGLVLPASPAFAQKRSGAGLVALYDFSSGSGAVVRDRSGSKKPHDLRIADPSNVRWVAGGLEFHKPTIASSGDPARSITDAIKRSGGAFTMESWIRPANTKQDGPARIVTLSRDSSNRNFTLGQDADQGDARFRTDRTGPNGVPSLQTGKRGLVNKGPIHLVYTRDRSGRAILYLDGKKVAEKKVVGSPKNWDPGYQLAVGNELSKDRPWLGTYYLVALYDRALDPRTVLEHFRAGTASPAVPAIAPPDQSAQLFETKIAAILANRCLECHDAATRKGKLDLSHKVNALAGGRDGPPIIPGKPSESLLWQTVASDEMPEDRPPLSTEDKAALKKWIATGAKWTSDFIDPADYAHGDDKKESQRFIRRLTVHEYIETVRATTGVDISTDAKSLLPPDLRADGFSNTAYNLGIDLKHIDAYARLADKIVAKVDAAAFAKRFSRNRSLTDKPMRSHIESMGKFVLRGPLEDAELNAFRGISTTVASAGGDFDEAISYILRAMLQSPRFIYMIENQEAGRPSGYEIASRLSYAIWGGPPDGQLIQAAERGDLHDQKKLGAQLGRMFDDPRAISRSMRFASDWLDLGRLNNLSPNPDRFPDWAPRLAADMRSETLAFFREIVWKQKAPLSKLFDSQFTFATPVLARHYGLEPVSKLDALERYDLSKTPWRGGLLTHGSILTVGGDDASMVTRGLFVLHDVLRGTVKDPPPGTDTTPVKSKPGVTQRSVAIDRIKSKSCGGCHAKFEPLAFGLERFDGTGAYRERDEHGNQLRQDGKILIPGEAAPANYQTSGELMSLLSGSDRVAETLTRKLVQFSLGRPLTSADRIEIGKIHAAAKKNGGTYQAVLGALAWSELIRANPRH